MSKEFALKGCSSLSVDQSPAILWEETGDFVIDSSFAHGLDFECFGDKGRLVFRLNGSVRLSDWSRESGLLAFRSSVCGSISFL